MSCASPKCEMRSVVVVVTDILVKQAFQVPFIQNDYRVKQILSAIANPTLCDTVLPRTSEAAPLGQNAEALHGVDDFSLKFAPRSKIR
jgi:hypothetical protein